MSPEFMVYVPEEKVNELSFIPGLRILGVISREEVIWTDNRRRVGISGVNHSERIMLSGERIRDLRKLQNLSRIYLARNAQVSEGYVSLIENQRLKVGSSPDIAIKIAKVLGIPLDGLVYEGQSHKRE